MCFGTLIDGIFAGSLPAPWDCTFHRAPRLERVGGEEIEVVLCSWRNFWNFSGHRVGEILDIDRGGWEGVSAEGCRCSRVVEVEL